MKTAQADIVREYGPFPGIDAVHGVSFDGNHVWFASGDRINELDPESGTIVRSIEVAGHAGTAFDGRHLYQIAEKSIRKIDPATGTVRARAVFPNPDASILPGQFVRIVPKGLVRQAAMVVPQAAVMQGPQGTFVYLVGDDSKAKVQPVRPGNTIGSEWLIEEGLKPGDQVIVDGVIKVRPGAPVKPAAAQVQPGKPADPAPAGQEEKQTSNAAERGMKA